MRLSGAEIEGHCRISICHRQGISSGFFASPGDKSDVCNERGEFDPKGPASRLPGRPHHLGDKGGVASELHTTPFHVGARDIQLVSGQPFGTFKDLNDLDIIFERIAEDVGDNGRIEFSQYWEFFGHEGANAHVLKADSIQHSGGGGVKAGWRCALDGLAGKALGHKAAETVQIDEVGKFEAVTEGAAGGKNGIPQAQRANLHA